MYFISVGFMMTQTFTWSREAGINTGVLSAVFGICAFTTAVVFWFKFNEVLSFGQIFSMILIFISIILLSIESNASKAYSEDKAYSQSYAALAIIMAILTFIPFTAKSYVVRKYCGKDFNLWEYNRDGTFWESIVYTVILIVMAATAWRGEITMMDWVFGFLGFSVEYAGKQF